MKTARASEVFRTPIGRNRIQQKEPTHAYYMANSKEGTSSTESDPRGNIFLCKTLDPAQEMKKVAKTGGDSSRAAVARRGPDVLRGGRQITFTKSS